MNFASAVLRFGHRFLEGGGLHVFEALLPELLAELDQLGVPTSHPISRLR
jgi:hypothetical protein